LGLIIINVGTNACDHIHAPAALLLVKEPPVPTGRMMAVWRGVEGISVYAGNLNSIVQQSHSSHANFGDSDKRVHIFMAITVTW
jgi:hypothetical protein